MYIKTNAVYESQVWTYDLKVTTPPESVIVLLNL